MILFLLFTQHHKCLRNGAVYYICAVTHTLFFILLYLWFFLGWDLFPGTELEKKKLGLHLQEL